MPNSADRLRNIKTFKQLVRYLEDELDWPLEEYGFDELTFEYSPAELGLKEEDADKVKIYQLRPIYNGQPWGIFFVEFHKKRMPVVVLRRILSHLVLKKRASANKAQAAAWSLDDLLFISAFGEQASDQREIAFAHFHQEKGDLPTLRVLGWDGADTALKLEHVDATLHERLRWPSNQADVDTWRQQWSRAFRHRIGHVIRTADALAEVLATLARSIRDAARTLMDHESERGQLRKLHKAFQTALIHDLTEDSFSDTYAQTITYGLLTAAISRTEMSEGRHGTALIAENVTDMVPITNPFLREMLETFIQAGGRKGGIDFDELGIQDVVELLRGGETDLPAILRDFGNRTRGEDPVIHFYEHFLKAYNKQLKIQRGVFYTPQPVVFHIVRSVHELLQTMFGIEDGLASNITWREMAMRNPDINIPDSVEPDSPFVMVLDPATGTATFLVEVIDVIYHTVINKWKKAGMSSEQQRTAWNDYVPHNLLPRLYGYELMMAPYAIAHMKIGLKLFETGYTFSSAERVRIYLTNALEPESDIQHKLAGVVPALAHEAQAVNEIKRKKRFTVVIGNPPYSHLSSNLSSEAMAIVEPYKFIKGERLQERGALSLQKNLQDDYVKFIRIAEQLIETTGKGIVGLISNNSYLDSRSFRGMRFHLSQTFNIGYILDLHGSGKKDEAVSDGTTRDVNVFDIMQGVAISLWIRNKSSISDVVMKRKDLLGSRDSKYEYLSTHTAGSSEWQSFEIAPPFYAFVKQNLNLLSEWQTFTSLRDIFPIYSSGVKTHRDDFAYSFTKQEEKEKLRYFSDSKYSDQELRVKYGLKDTNVWSLKEQRRRVKLSELQLSILPALYRPFDIRITCFSDEIIELTRRAVMDQMLDGNNIALLCSQQQAEEGFRHVFCTRLISDWGSVSNRTRESTSSFPLWLHRPVRKSLSQHDLNLDNGPISNVHSNWITKYKSPEVVFKVVYCILHSNSYRNRYSAFLRSDFPRIPLISDLKFNGLLEKLGAALIELHLMESPKLDKYITSFVGDEHQVVEKVVYFNKTIWIDKAKTCGFTSVPELVWQFHIGGYQVCEKWLKDRKDRKLLPDDIEHYQRIVVAINETIKLMVKIDEVIEQHGGWPLK